MADEEAVGFDFDTLAPEEFEQVAESAGITLLPAQEPEDGAEATDAEGEDVEEVEAAEEAETTDGEGEQVEPDGDELAGSPLDPAGMAAVAASCEAEALGYVESLTQLAAQVGESDPKAAKKIAALAKQATGLAKDVTKIADKAQKAAEKDKLGEAADLARECSTTCAEIRALIDQARELVDGADLPDDAAPAAEEPKAPTRSAIEAWATDMLG